MQIISFKCAVELDEMADRFEQDGYARDVVRRVRELASDIRNRGCGNPALCPGCGRSLPGPCGAPGEPAAG